MFTGIIETTGIIQSVEREGSNVTYSIDSTLCQELKVDQSIAHDGVCLTVIELQPETNIHKVTAIWETLQKTNLSQWQVGKKVNLERCLTLNGRLDGHIVQGHVDTVGTCIERKDMDGSWLFTIQHPIGEFITVEKGSICLNGVSLTVVDSADGQFSVAIIPYTYEFTNFHQLQPGDLVNLEFDVIGKYIQKLLGKGSK